MDNMRLKPVRDDRDAPTSPACRRQYETPTLTEYGSVAKLTQSMVTGSRVDGNGMSQDGACL
jgi:hypothetical protein